MFYYVGQITRCDLNVHIAPSNIYFCLLRVIFVFEYIFINNDIRNVITSLQDRA